MASRTDALDFYRSYGANTDPGEHTGLYEGLPDGLEDLCDLIKTQIIHALEVERYAGALP